MEIVGVGLTQWVSDVYIHLYMMWVPGRKYGSHTVWCRGLQETTQKWVYAVFLLEGSEFPHQGLWTFIKSNEDTGLFQVSF